MYWTRKAPTIEGWYWRKTHQTNTTFIIEVRSKDGQLVYAEVPVGQYEGWWSNKPIPVVGTEVIGEPALPVEEWLDDFARASEGAADDHFWPWQKSRFMIRAKAFWEAADMVRRSKGLPEYPERYIS